MRRPRRSTRRCGHHGATKRSRVVGQQHDILLRLVQRRNSQSYGESRVRQSRASTGRRVCATPGLNVNTLACLPRRRNQIHHHVLFPCCLHVSGVARTATSAVMNGVKCSMQAVLPSCPRLVAVSSCALLINPGRHTTRACSGHQPQLAGSLQAHRTGVQVHRSPALRQFGGPASEGRNYFLPSTSVQRGVWGARARECLRTACRA